jgi:hypothetical protein
MSRTVQRAAGACFAPCTLRIPDREQLQTGSPFRGDTSIHQPTYRNGQVQLLRAAVNPKIIQVGVGRRIATAT